MPTPVTGAVAAEDIIHARGDHAAATTALLRAEAQAVALTAPAERANQAGADAAKATPRIATTLAQWPGARTKALESLTSRRECIPVYNLHLG